MEDLVTQWRGRRILITGHTGFKGSWLSLWLSKLGATVGGLALDPEGTPNIFTMLRLSERMEDRRGDIRSYATVLACLREFAPEVVLHLAAQPLVRQSYADPVTTYATNVMGTVNILEAVRHTPTVRAVLCVTTDKCYHNQEWVWPYRETDALGGHDPYASSKACAEMVTSAYRSSFFPPEQIARHGIAVGSARAGNVIGGGDWSQDRLIPDLVRGFQTGVPVSIRRPKATRPWQHVLEPLHGYLKLSGKLREGCPEFAAAFNFGPSDEDVWSVERVASACTSLWGEDALWKLDEEPGVHEAHSLTLDSSRARAMLKWQPCLHIRTALRWTIDWYKAADRGEDMVQFCLDQIAAYEEQSAGSNSHQVR
jgi:CDP-glucose 4,6-dehydratase